MRNRDIYFLVEKIGTGESTFAQGKSRVKLKPTLARTLSDRFAKKRLVITLLFMLEKRSRLDPKLSILNT